MPNTTDSSGKTFLLTNNSGSHAVAMSEYYDRGTYRVWTSILAERAKTEHGWPPAGNIRAYEYKDIGNSWYHWDRKDPAWPSWNPERAEDPRYRAYNCHVAINWQNKVYTWGNPYDICEPDARFQANTTTAQNWAERPDRLNRSLDDVLPDVGAAVALFRPNGGSAADASAVFCVRDTDNKWIVYGLYSTYGGTDWEEVETGGADGEIAVSNWYWFSHPSLATNDDDGHVYLVYDSIWNDVETHSVMFRKSTDKGVHWPTLPGDSWQGVKEPSIAAIGQYVLICVASQDHQSLRYKYSTDGGSNWYDTISRVFQSPGGAALTFDHANVSAESCPDGEINRVNRRGFLVVARAKVPDQDGPMWTVRGEFVHMNPGSSKLYLEPLYMSAAVTPSSEAPPLNPSVASVYWRETKHPIACCVWSGTNTAGNGRCILESHGMWYARPPFSKARHNTGRLLSKGAGDVMQFASSAPPFVTAGPVIGGYP
ncbi:exo-alpha-sialidase, partial [candidate division WOR-3 bacterium]|nr:exo-alpha-sialidase [candidate division WOR-3 bacterium]